MARTDIVLSQESHLQRESFFDNFPGWRSFRNDAVRSEAGANEEGEAKRKRRGRWTAGTVIWIRESFLENFMEPDHLIIRGGYVHYVVLRPKARVDVRFPVFTEPFTVLNIYLHSTHQLDSEKLELIREMQREVLPTKFIFTGGDTNIKWDPSDISGGTATVGDIREAFADFLKGKGLMELYQPLPTRMDSRAWSIVDRFFVATPAGVDMEDFMDLTVSLPKHPFMPWSEGPHPSDHFQLLLTPSPASLDKKARFVIPKWLARSPDFVKRFKTQWLKLKARALAGKLGKRARRGGRSKS